MKNIVVLQIILVLVLTFIPDELQKVLDSEVEKEHLTARDKLDFETWMIKFGKKYDNDFTLTHRFQIFERNRKLIERHNLVSTQSKWGLNSFSDMEVEELKHYLFLREDFDQSVRIPNSLISDKDRKELLNHPILTQMRTEARTGDGLDWSDKVPPVAHQGMCGSCWAFTSTDVTVSRLALKGKAKLKPLSKSHIIDCQRDNCGGCQGGSPLKVYEYINAHGGLYEKDYREYNEAQEDCAKPNGDVGKGDIIEFASITDNTVEAMKEALESGPVVGMMYSDASWFSFKSGVLDTCSYEKDKAMMHAVLIVGYNKKNWIIKNSWGTDWGENGFFKVAMRGEDNCVDKIKKISFPVVK